MDQVQTMLFMQQIMTANNRTEDKSAGKSETGSDFRKMMDQQREEARPAPEESAEPAKKEPVQQEATQETEALQQQEEEVDAGALQQMAAAQMAYVDAAKLVVTQQQAAPGTVQAVVTNTAAAAQGSAAQNAPTQNLAENQMAQTQTAPQQAQTAEPVVQKAETSQQPQTQNQNQELPQQQKSADASAKPQADGMKTTVTTEQDASAETPVFKQVETTPIKVSETTAAPKTAETGNVNSQIADNLAKAMANGESKVQIQLTPENLGKVTIELTQREDGTLRVVIQAENVQTRMLLEKDMSGLQNLLGRTTQQEVQVEVPRGEESQQHQDLTEDDQQQQQRQQEDREEDQPTEDFMNQLRLGLVSVEDENE